MTSLWPVVAAIAVLGHPSGLAGRSRTYRSGDSLYLETTDGRDTIRVGVAAKWGGAIVDLSYNGHHLVNAWDPGREIQASIWDGADTYDACGGCSGTFGWNPVQAGDRHGHGGPVVADSLAPDYIYTKTDVLEWFPDNKGGGSKNEVRAGLTLEQWVSVSPRDWRIIQVHYVATYLGKTVRVNSWQELPAVYVNSQFDRFVYYGGTAPWTDGPVTDTIFPVSKPTALLYMPEKWAALVDTTGFGVTVYLPRQYPYGGGHRIESTLKPAAWSTVYYRPLVYFTVMPGRQLLGDYFLIPGDYRTARHLLAEYRDNLPAVGDFSPFGVVDLPKADASLSGITRVAGWAIGNDSVKQVDVFVDGTQVGSATYGSPRPDILHPYIAGPAKCGFNFSWDTHDASNGRHSLSIHVTDVAGNTAIFKPVEVTIQN